MEEKTIQELNEGRVIKVAAPALYPLLETMKQREISTMVSKFRNNETDFLGSVAAISALEELRTRFDSMIRKSDKAAMKLHQGEKDG